VRLSVPQFIEADHRRWIFPLRTPLAYAKAGEKELRAHISKMILDAQQPEGFVAGHVAFSRKDAHHLRRVLVLDPISIFFLYDFVVSHRSHFPKAPRGDRQSFGHAFHRGAPVDAFAAYHEFRRRKYALRRKCGVFAHLDVFNCFNSFYHHDVASFVSTSVGRAAGQAFGQFLRELNAGVSVACFPQGLYPAKVIGNAYLSFVEKSRSLKVQALIRFLDDIVLFTDGRSEVEAQVLEVQYLLDKHHLALNDAKTVVGDRTVRFGERRLDAIRRSLVKKRETIKSGYDEDDEEEVGLSRQEREYLSSLIHRPNIAQEDVELALALMRQEADALESLLGPVLDAAPHLLRGLHRFIGVAQDHGETWAALKERITSTRKLPEHDLFWYARILLDYYEFDQDVADSLLEIFRRPESTAIVKAAILESRELEHGFADLKERELRNAGDLLILSAAMLGLVGLEKGRRNQLFKYASRQGAHAAMLSSIATRVTI
jgi:Reverse transcriptase (RNA-dependent DNA polymerase)